MPIAVSGTPTTAAPTAAATSVTINVPSGIANGDLLLWVASGNVATVAPTPAGWNVYQTGTGTAQNLSIFYRFASNEPASYTHSTLTSGKWAFTMAGFSGVDATTPLDVAVPAYVAGTTAVAFPAITPVTSGAWILAVAHVQGATGATFAFTNGNTDALVVVNQPASGINASNAIARRAWTTGAFTPTMTYTGTSTRTLGATGALRPAASAAAPVQFRRIGRRR